MPRQTPKMAALPRQNLGADRVPTGWNCWAENAKMLLLNHRGEQKADISQEGEHLVVFPHGTWLQWIREKPLLQTGALAQMSALGIFLQRRIKMQRCYKKTFPEKWGWGTGTDPSPWQPSLLPWQEPGWRGVPSTSRPCSLEYFLHA